MKELNIFNSIFIILNLMMVGFKVYKNKIKVIKKKVVKKVLKKKLNRK
jgi:hypothetical protein